MVQVPITPQRSVQVQPLDTKPMRYSRVRNYVGEAVEQFGNALSQSAETWDAIEAAYDQANHVDSDNQFAVAAADKATEFDQLKGDTPARQLNEFTEALNSKREELLAGARSERARNMMKRSLDTRYENARIGMQKHADAEMFTFRDNGLVSGIEIASKDAVRGYGTERFDLGLATAELRLNERARLNGWSPEQLAEETAKLNAGVRYDAVVSLAAQGEPTAALAQAEEWKDKFDPEQYSRLNNLLRPRAEAKIARELVPGIIEEAAVSAPKPKGGEAAGNPSPVANAKPIAEQLYPGIRVTSTRRKAGEAGKAGANSWHVKSGAALDAAPIAGMSFQQYVQGYRDAGYTIIEAIDETDPATMKRTGATGPHWHVVLGEKGSGGAPGSSGAALDPRMDPEFAADAARKYAEKHKMSESQTDALIDAARDQASDNLRRRNLVEQEEERQFDQILLDRGIDPDTVTNEADIPPEAWDGLSPSSRLQKREAIARNRERVEKAREEQRQAALLQQAVIAGGAVDYSNPQVKKAGNALYAQQLNAQGGMSPDQLMNFNLKFAQQVGFVPPIMQSQIRAQLASPDPQLQINAARTLEEMRVRNPALLATFSESEVARAEQINEYRRRGVPPKDAADRVAELERMPKADRDARKSLFAGQVKAAGDATEFLKDQFGVAPSAAMVGDFRAAWQREFVRTGDIELARATAFASLRRQWGVTYVNGSAQTMKYPPELTYGKLDRGEDDARWIRDQAFKEL